jgi:hypothetical protein
MMSEQNESKAPWDGFPPGREQGGWHFLRRRGQREFTVGHWRPGNNFPWLVGSSAFRPDEAAAVFDYEAPCATPTQVWERENAAREAGRAAVREEITAVVVAYEQLVLGQLRDALAIDITEKSGADAFRAGVSYRAIWMLLQKLRGEGGTPPASQETPETEAELREMMRDPRYWRHREPDMVKRVSEGFRRLVGRDASEGGAHG